MKAAFFTLGCKVNQYETQEMTEILKRNGYEITDIKDNADIFIINSCTVTAESNRKTRQAVRHYKAKNPDAIIVLTGCVPQAFPEEAESLSDYADIILGNNNNYKIIDAINDVIKNKKNVIDIINHTDSAEYRGGIITEFEGHTRAFVKIQDGCNRFCSYCAIPYARGRARSKSLDAIKAELDILAKNDFKEVVFVGINLSSYGREYGLSLVDAVAAAQNTDGIERVRLGSLEPDHISSEMINGFAECSKFCPQFHISLQSGCDSVLKRMNRHYNSSEYSELVCNLRNVFPDASITTDIIAGFPGETDEEFFTTVEFARKIKFDKVHVFPYSIREGTRAAKMPCQLTNQIKSARAAELCSVCEEIRKESFRNICGKTFSVLFETPKDDYQVGYTMNYTPVMVKSDECLTNKIRNVLITDIDNEYCIGELV